jgi:hypothetical protein
MFVPAGLDRKCWSTAVPILTIFRNAFERAGLGSCNPHSFSKPLARLGEQRCRTPEDGRAWSQNLGHEQALTIGCVGLLERGGKPSRRTWACQDEPRLRMVAISRFPCSCDGFDSGAVSTAWPSGAKSKPLKA